MRIAFFSEVYWPMVSGVARTLERTVAALTARGHAVRVYTATYPLPAGASDRVEVHRSPSRPLFLSPEVQWAFPHQGRILADLAGFAPDVVHCLTEFSLGRAGARAARTLGVPLVASAHTDYESYAGRYGLDLLVGPGWEYLRRFYQAARIVLAPGRLYEARLHARGVHHTGIWSRGVDTAEFHPRFRSDAWRARFGVGRDDVLVTCVGRLAPEKSVPLLLDAWERVARRHPGAHLVFVGRGAMEGAIRGRALPRVHLAGLLRGDALATAYASSDLFVQPSATETFGNVLLEAMASGVASLSVGAGGVLDFALDRHNTLLVPPGDPAALASALAAAIADPGLRRPLQAAGLATARARGWDPVIDRLLEDYVRVIGSAPPARPLHPAHAA